MEGVEMNVGWGMGFPSNYGCAVRYIHNSGI
jgi:hypothetical protein